MLVKKALKLDSVVKEIKEEMSAIEQELEVKRQMKDKEDRVKVERERLDKETREMMQKAQQRLKEKKGKRDGEDEGGVVKVKREKK